MTRQPQRPPQGSLRRVVTTLSVAALVGALIGALAASVDCRRILINGDFVETVFLHRLWLTVTMAGALTGFVLGSIVLLVLAPLTIRRGRPLPSLPASFRWLAIPIFLVFLYIAVLYAAAPISEGRLPLRKMDQACGGRTASTGLLHARENEPPPTSVILLLLDTVRADHLSVYGYHRPTTPTLEQLAGESLVCDSARSTASWTLPAHGTLFTGLYPSQHRMHSYHPDDRAKDQPRIAAYPMASSIVTMPTLLRRAGFQTAAIYANPILSPCFRLDRGFDLYLGQNNYNSRLPLLTEPVLAAAPWSGWLKTFRKSTPSARQISRRVTHWLDYHARPPFFLFVNYMDAHWPYLPPPPYDTLFPGKSENTPSMHQLRKAVLGRQRELTGPEWDSLQSQYDGEIRYLDEQLGVLFDHLRRRGIFDSSLIIVTSDHGEYFGEHQLVFHGRDLYEGGVKIPLLVKYPHGTPRGHLTEPAGLEDVFPTIMQVLGLSVAGEISGVPLGATRPGPTVAENFYSFKFDLENPDFGSRFDRIRRSMVIERHKFIHSSDGRHELYDLVLDPDESDNLLSRHPELAEPFLPHLQALEQAAARPRAREDLVVPRDAGTDEEIQRQLEELGYVEEETP